MPRQACPTGSGLVTDIKDADFCRVPSLDSCLKFFSRVGGEFMVVVDEVLSRLVNGETFSWKRVQGLKSEKNTK
jgi:hypothetical protein